MGDLGAQPVQALAELMGISFDADATRVDVEFDYDGLGGMSEIVVSDNGDGTSSQKQSPRHSLL